MGRFGMVVHIRGIGTPARDTLVAGAPARDALVAGAQTRDTLVASARARETHVAQDRRRYLGVDVGGTKMLAVVAEGSGKIVVRRRVATPREGGPTQVFGALVEVIEAALAAAKMEADDVAAIGVGVPGVVDPTTGVLLAAPNMDFVGPVTAPLTERFGVPAALGNDGNVAILAEQQFGAAKGADSAVGIFWGTGIGGGIICHGRLVDGATHAAAEIGHMVMQLDGPL